MGDGAPEVPQQNGQNNRNDNIRLLEAFLKGAPADGGVRRFGEPSFLRMGTPPNQDTFNQVQRRVDADPNAVARLREFYMTPWAERSGAKAALVRDFGALADLEDSANRPALNGRLPGRIDTRMCHTPQRYEPPPPTPYRIGDLMLPSANQAGLDAMSARAVHVGNANLNDADGKTFAKAVDEIAHKTSISLADRTNILCRLSVMISRGDHRALPDESARQVALGLAQTIAHPPAGDLGRRAIANPAGLSEDALQYATRGRIRREGTERELTDTARQQIRDARSQQEAVQRLFGSTRIVTPDSFTLDLTTLDRPPAFLNEETVKALREIHEQDGRIRSIYVSHRADGDDRISIGLEAGRTEGDITLARNLGMTVHREADGSYRLMEMGGIEADTHLVGKVNVRQLNMGKPGDPNRRIVGTAVGFSRDVTDQVDAGLISRFDGMIQMLDRINQQRR